MSTKKVITIHISESGTVKNKSYRSAIIGAIVLPFNDRKEVKEAIKIAIEKGGVEASKRVLKWTKISPKEQYVYMNVLTALNNDDLVKYYAVRINNFEYYKIIPAYVKLIKKVSEDYPDYEIRVFIQANKAFKYNRIAIIENELKKEGYQANINQVFLEESRFIQCADLIGGALLYYYRDDMYLEKIGQEGKPAIVEHGLSLKKKQGKIKIYYLEEEKDE